MYPQLLKIGPLVIYTYGFFILLAFVIPYLLARKEVKTWGISEEFLTNLWILLLLGGLGGGKLLYIFLHLPSILKNPLSGGNLRGGFAYLGGFAGAFLAGAIYIRIRKESLPRVSYILTPYIPLGQAIGRWGCFFNGCCYGRPTLLPWGMVFPLNSPAGYHYGALPLHPAQLYASLFNLVFFLFLWKLRNKGRHKYRLLPLYFLIYLLFRGALEFVRGDVIPVINNITLLHVTLPFLLTFTFIWWKKWKMD